MNSNYLLLIARIAYVLARNTEEDIAEMMFNGTLEGIGFTCKDCPCKSLCKTMLPEDAEEPNEFTCKDVVLTWLKEGHKDDES